MDPRSSRGRKPGALHRRGVNLALYFPRWRLSSRQRWIHISSPVLTLQLAVLDRAIADCTESRRLSEKAFSFRSFPSWSRRGCRSSAARARLFIYISRHFRAQSVRNPYSRISGIRESHEGFIRFDAAARRRNA